MPKPNYAFEKRQRELAKKQKKAEKAQRKESGRTGGTDAEADLTDDAGATGDAVPEDGSAPATTEQAAATTPER